MANYRIGPLGSVQVSIPVTATPEAQVRELRLEYRMLGIPKHAVVPFSLDL